MKKLSKYLPIFSAITRPWIGYSRDYNSELIFINENVDKNLTKQIIENFDEKTAAVCVSLVQFSSGTCLYILKLRAATREFGIKLVIDITQEA